MKEKGFCQKRNKIKDTEIAVIIAVIHLCLSFVYSSFFFRPDADTCLAKRNMLLVNILLFIFLTLLYRGAIWLIRNRKQYRSYIRFGILYFSILMFLLFLTWPGVWRHDDMTVAINAKQYAIDGWQHVITSLFYMISFRILPIYASVVICQCGMIAAITSYLYNEMVGRLRHKTTVRRILLCIPFFLPPVLDNSLYPLRPILFSYFLILLMYLMIKYFEKKHLKNQQLLLLLPLIIICCTWRSEGIYLLPLAVAYFYLFLKKKKISIRFAVASLLIIFSGFFMIKALQDTTLNNHDQLRYKLSGTVHMAAPLIRTASADGDNAALLNDIDKVVSVSAFLEHPDYSGESIFWLKGAVRDNFTNDDYSRYLNSVIGLILKYPGVAVSNRIDNFLITSALRPNKSNTIQDTTTYYDYPDITSQSFIDTGGRFMKQWNPTLRSVIIRILEGRNVHDYATTTITYPIFWNLIIPLTGILVAIIYFINKKNTVAALIITSILLKTSIVFLTAPASYHMYYHAEYMLGYAMIFYVAADSVIRHKRHNRRHS